MTDTQRLNYLRVALVLTGITAIGLYPLMIVWPDGWVWHTGHSEYPLMIVGMYATLGVFLIFAALNPLAHLSLIWVRGVVERGAWRDHGDPGPDECPVPRPSSRRRAGASTRGARFRAAHSPR